ncbi:hypothetical protein ATZ36_17430 [Candidatus Endomicrobiellum trichonymphae]|uniref:Uncharacterized protein n=1 Tax=Endomicrobium trichonymphae TaxID=1408204 RepID=A0A1E5IJZ8_ENDTX|nr:hypothetical protein ATZ36_17430 [Candidatus Endomicrobium trichonymphae]
MANAALVCRKIIFGGAFMKNNSLVFDKVATLKLYLRSYRMVGMVHESVVNSILSDLVKTIKPKEMCMNMEFGIRGGLTATVFGEYLSRETKEK